MNAREELNRIKEKWALESDNELSKKLNTNKTNIDSWVKRNKIPDKWKIKIGQIELQEEQNVPQEKINHINNSSYTFDVLNVKASAGEGIENYEVEVIDSMSLDKMFFKTPPNTKKTKIIEVVGDSMIPTLLPGDHVLVDESKLYGIDGIYAIQMQGQIFIKRLQFNLDGTIDIISDNPKYSTRMFNPNDNQTPLSIIGMKTLSVQR